MAASTFCRVGADDHGLSVVPVSETLSADCLVASVPAPPSLNAPEFAQHRTIKPGVS